VVHFTKQPRSPLYERIDTFSSAQCFPTGLVCLLRCRCVLSRESSDSLNPQNDGCAPLKLALFQNEMMTFSFLSRQDKATPNTIYTVASPYALPCAHLLLPLLLSPTVLSPATTPLPKRTQRERRKREDAGPTPSTDNEEKAVAQAASSAPSLRSASSSSLASVSHEKAPLIVPGRVAETGSVSGRTTPLRLVEVR